MKFRYSFIMIDHQIDEKTSNFDQKIGPYVLLKIHQNP